MSSSKFRARTASRMMVICNNLELFEQMKKVDDERRSKIMFEFGAVNEYCVKIGNIAKKCVGYKSSTNTHDIGWSLFVSYKQGKHLPYLLFKKSIERGSLK